MPYSMAQTSIKDSINQLKDGGVYTLSAEDVVLNEKSTDLSISLAARKEQKLEEAPSIVSVISKKEIENYGCRDMSDVFRLVPGFEFGIDVQQIIGLGFRGTWVHEGKVLIMINGSAINDQGYGNYNFVGTLPVQMIERVEIIRGPGSALYGGFAEVATINIITKKGNQLKGGELISNAGLISKDGLSKGGSFAFGNEYRQLNIAVMGGIYERPLASGTYKDFFGGSMPLNFDYAPRKFHYLNTTLNYKKLSFHYNQNVFNYNGEDGFDAVVPRLPRKTSTEGLNHTITNLALSYKWELHPKLTIEPLLEAYIGNNIATGVNAASQIYTNYSTVGTSTLNRYRAELLNTYTYSPKINLLLGVGYLRDEAHLINNNSEATLKSPNYAQDSAAVFSRFTTSNYIFTQLTYNPEHFNITTGIRYENTSFGNAFAPRLGVTYFYKKFNVKALFGSSYRIPTPFQGYAFELNNPKELTPETSNTFEIEIGYKLMPSLSLKANTFLIQIDNVIVYTGSLNAYINEGKVYTKGIESEAKYTYKNVEAFGNMSYTLPEKVTTPQFLTPDKQNILALATWKSSGGVSLKLKKVTTAISYTYIGERFGQAQNYAIAQKEYTDNIGNDDNTSEELLIEPEKKVDKYSPIFITNLTFNIREIFKNTDLQLFGQNIFDTQYLAIQPFYGLHAPISITNRHIGINLKLKF
jgi:outer membrane cobalamin receptor